MVYLGEGVHQKEHSHSWAELPPHLPPSRFPGGRLGESNIPLLHSTVDSWLLEHSPLPLSLRTNRRSPCRDAPGFSPGFPSISWCHRCDLPTWCCYHTGPIWFYCPFHCGVDEPPDASGKRRSADVLSWWIYCSWLCANLMVRIWRQVWLWWPWRSAGNSKYDEWTEGYPVEWCGSHLLWLWYNTLDKSMRIKFN